MSEYDEFLSEYDDVLMIPEFVHGLADTLKIPDEYDYADLPAIPVKAAVSEWRPTRQELSIMLTLSLISLMVSLDATIIVTSLSTITKDINGTATEGFWIGTSYLLTSAAPMPFIASLSDIFGRSQCLFSSVVLFTIGSILCAVSKSITILLTGRCIQGVGGGGIIILSLVIITDVVPLRFRPKYYGIVQGAWAFGTCAGPVIGGAFAQNTTWRWNFYLMFPFCAMGLVGIPLLVRLQPRKATWTEMVERVDWLGGFLFISSITSFLIAVSWGGTQEPWRSPRTLVPLVSGILGVCLTLLWEKKGAKEPFLRHSLFYCPSSFIVYFGAFVQGLLLYGQLYYVPFYFQSVHLATPVYTGVCILPITLILVPLSTVVGGLVTRMGTYRWAIWSGWAISTLGTGLTILWYTGTGKATWVIAEMILGLGHALTLNALSFASQAICLPGDEGATAAMYIFLRSFGMATGVGIGGSIFQNVMSSKLLQSGLPAEIARDAEGFVSTLRTLQDSTYRTKILDAYSWGFHGIYGGFCGLAAIAGIASLFLKHFSIDRELVTEHRLKQTHLFQKKDGPRYMTVGHSHIDFQGS